MGSGGGGSQQVSTTTSNLPEYAQPYFEGLLGSAGDVFTQPYTPYERPRIADFNGSQTQAQQETMGMQTPGQFGTASNLATAAGTGSLSAGQYAPSQINAGQVTAGTQSAPQMSAAQTGYNSTLQNYQMAMPDQFGQAQAQQYMSPYVQNVLDVQKQQAIRDAKQGQLVQNLGAARQGTYGGARQLLAGTERERNLQQNLGNIEATGLQAAYTNAQQQFGADRAAQMQAAQANQQASLGVQQLGTQTGLQTALANLTSEQQANVQNQAAQLQAQGLNAQQALQVALANQTSNLQSQQATEQSRQFGANLGLQGYNQALQGAQTLGQLGSAQEQGDLARLQAQGAVGSQQQALEQQYLDTGYEDFLRQQNYPINQLSYYSSILRGLPIQGTGVTTQATPSPSALGQLASAGLGAAGLSKLGAI